MSDTKRFKPTQDDLLPVKEEDEDCVNYTLLNRTEALVLNTNNNTIVESTAPAPAGFFSDEAELTVRPLGEVLDDLKNQEWSKDKIIDTRLIEPREAVFCSDDENFQLISQLDQTLVGHYARIIHDSTNSFDIKLYSHQACAIRRILNNENVGICTSTSSGKSLAFNLPILSKILENKDLTALYVYPTKSLAQDQLRILNSLVGSSLKCVCIDGDTPRELKESAFQGASVVLTNPDFLHASLLPNQKKSAGAKRFVKNLKYVMIDEAHVYRGAFGSHVANVIRRLRRVKRLLYNVSEDFNSSFLLLLSESVS
jgi:ATP-dependent helicase YprA (DUF1998 family)